MLRAWSSYFIFVYLLVVLFVDTTYVMLRRREGAYIHLLS